MHGGTVAGLAHLHRHRLPDLFSSQGLGLEQYQATFEEQEIDLTVVHAITAEELASIGVADRLHQVRGAGWLLQRAAQACRGTLRWAVLVDWHGLIH